MTPEMRSSTPRATSARWRLLDTPPARGAFNMALDHALAESVRAGLAPVLRFYRWSPACLSLGRHQPATGHYDREALRARGIEVVRRPTGGRAVLHHRELTYSVIMPDRSLGPPRAAYSAINAALVAGLRRLGVAAMRQPAGRRAPAPSLDPRFREPAEGEVVIDGRKLIGSAQVRESGVTLQHGSLLLRDDQSLVSDLLLDGSARAAERPATLAEHLDPLPSWKALVAALVGGWVQELGGSVGRDEPSADESARARELEQHYDDPAWTWREPKPKARTWHGPGIGRPLRASEESPPLASRKSCDI